MVTNDICSHMQKTKLKKINFLPDFHPFLVPKGAFSAKKLTMQQKQDGT